MGLPSRLRDDRIPISLSFVYSFLPFLPGTGYITESLGDRLGWVNFVKINVNDLQSCPVLIEPPLDLECNFLLNLGLRYGKQVIHQHPSENFGDRCPRYIGDEEIGGIEVEKIVRSIFDSVLDVHFDLNDVLVTRKVLVFCRSSFSTGLGWARRRSPVARVTLFSTCSRLRSIRREQERFSRERHPYINPPDLHHVHLFDSLKRPGKTIVEPFRYLPANFPAEYPRHRLLTRFDRVCT